MKSDLSNVRDSPLSPRGKWVILAGVKVIMVIWVLASPVFALPSNPGEAALHFLEKIRSHKINLDSGGDTAITAEITDHKKQQISHRYDRMANDFGDMKLEVAEIRQDEGFAGVLVKQISVINPEHLQILALALVKRGETWRVAPVPASFENTGNRSDPSLKERLRAIENWLLRGQVTELEKLKSEAANELKRRIRESIREEDLVKTSAEEALAQFIDACEKKNITLMLAFLGGISKEQPEDWLLRLKAANRAVAKFSVSSPAWERLTSRDTLKVISSTKVREREQNFTVESLTPSTARLNQSQITRIHIHLSRTIDNFWRVDLPSDFTLKPSNSEEHGDAKPLREISENFGQLWAKSHLPIPQMNGETAFANFNKVLNQRSLVALVRLADLITKPNNASKTCVTVSEFWSRFVVPASIIRYSVPLSFTERESSAVGLIQWVSMRDPEKFETLPILFEKTPSGWLWIPNPDSTSLETYREWLKTQTEDASKHWQERLFTNTPLFDATQTSPHPSPEECGKVIQDWITATEGNDVQLALSLSVRLDDLKSGGTLLQNIGYEISNTMIRINPPNVLKLYHGIYWSGIGVQVEQKGGKFTYPFYPMVRTSLGPRILAEIDLFATENNSREFLNSAALDRLQKYTSEEIASDLRKLFMSYQADLVALKK